MLAGKARRKKGAGWFTILLIAVVAYFGYHFLQQGQFLNAVNNDCEAMESRLKDAQQQNARLREEKAGLEDLRHVEKVAREELNMVRQGELPYVVARH